MTSLFPPFSAAYWNYTTFEYVTSNKKCTWITLVSFLTAVISILSRCSSTHTLSIPIYVDSLHKPLTHSFVVLYLPPRLCRNVSKYKCENKWMCVFRWVQCDLMWEVTVCAQCIYMFLVRKENITTHPSGTDWFQPVFLHHAKTQRARTTRG